eukprot:CAMPEP_0119570414 /NCGR_PEP_ID=MMETSP1352-20130426/43602_1 /TAXON_ID=265584 /ORGANISM="Stauroneis constricta, Strain CCMP1120" /LENGTH=76 /DNA_ID=CAMNT_0007620083 /DNA_START=254 /DNA_END=484 /DNA_ORIENTATION=+
MNIFDGLKSMFSEEGKQKRAEAEKRKREEEEAALQEILERRRNPEKMREYEQRVYEFRQGMFEDDKKKPAAPVAEE